MSRIFRRWLCVVSIATLALALNPTEASGGRDGVGVVGEAIIAGDSGYAQSAAVATPGCADFAYALKPWHLPANYRWYYNPANAPAAIASTALAAITASSKTVASGYNRCGSVPNLPTKQQYMGTTRTVAQVGANGDCNGNDGRSTISWGTLPSSYLAYTCVYYQVSSGQVLSADVLIDNKAHQWFTTRPVNCVNAYDLGSVMTHERGHTAGLEHVDRGTSAAQTMSPQNLPCDTSKLLLGAGDLAGLRHVYHVG
jgi:hypothetical protein